MISPAAILAVVLAAGSIWLELRRPDRRRLPLRISAALVAAIAMALLVDPPRIAVARHRETALLVTDGARPGEIRRVADSIRAALILRADSSADLRTLRSRHPGIRRIVVVGWGLDSIELAALRDVMLDFVPSETPPGIGAIDWPREIALGEDVVVRGRADALARVRIVTEWGAVDSATADSAGSFELRTRPRAAGFVRLAVQAGTRRDTLAVWARETRPPPLLIFRSRPSFETSRLRDWLGARGGTVLARWEVTAGRARVDRVNTELPTPRPVTSALLDSFDVLWIDARALQRLSGAEADVVRAAVNAGLGVLLEPEDLGPARRFFGEPFPSVVAGPEARPARLRWSDGRSAPPIPVQRGEISDRPGRRTVASDERGRVVASWSPIGSGAVVVSLVPRPSRWLLEGERPAYDAYWSRVLGAARRPRPRWEASAEAFPAPHRPVVVGREATGAVAALVRTPSGNLDTMYADPVTPTRVEGRYWPREPGPHVISGAGDSLGFEVFPAASWPTVRAVARRDATRRWAALQGGAAAAAVPVLVSSPVPRGWLFGLLLAGVSLLWWERRAI